MQIWVKLFIAVVVFVLIVLWFLPFPLLTTWNPLILPAVILWFCVSRILNVASVDQTEE